MAQSLSRVYLHLIFSTKNRHPWLTSSIRQQLYPYLSTLFKEHESPAVQIGGVDDHVHALFLLSRTVSQAQMVEEVKKHSSRKVKEWDAAAADFAWQSGYGMFSVSQSRIEAARQYILRQEEYHRTVTFQDEYRAFLKKYQVPYDERYVWD